MISIKAGPTMRKFAIQFLQELDFDDDEATDELVAAANAYVHGPWPEQLIPYLEETEELRWESFKKYIKWRLENSVTGRIKKQLEIEKNESKEKAA